MKKLGILFSAIFALAAVLPIGSSAQVASSEDTTTYDILDIVFHDEATGQVMSLTKNIDEFPLLLVLDHTIIERDNQALADIDIDKDTLSRKELATILGVKPEQVKAFILLKGNDATSLWGTRGHNGVLDVLSPKMYDQIKKEGRLDKRYRLAQ